MLIISERAGFFHKKSPQTKPERHLFSILNYLKHLLRHRFLFLLFNLRLRFPKLFSHRRHFRQYHYQGRDKSFGYFYDLQDTASTPFRLPRSMKYSDVFPIHLLCHFPTGCWRNFLFLRNKIAIRLHFLKSYSFATDNIELLLVLIIRIILSTYKFFPSSYAFFIIST